MFIGAALVIAALAMTSCNGEGCYKLYYKMDVLGVEVETAQYVYGNSEDIDAAEEAMKKAAGLVGGEVEIHRVKVHANAEDCAAKNVK